MKVILHDIRYDSLFSVICSLVTGSSFSHASISVKGKIYDTTFSRGYFAETEQVFNEPDRDITVIEIPVYDAVSVEAFINHHKTKRTRYDVVGLLLWPLGVHVRKQYYCFEAVCDLLKHGGIDLKLGRKPSAGKMFKALLGKGYHADRTSGRYYLR